MPRAGLKQVTLYYKTSGLAALAMPLVLIYGLGAQMLLRKTSSARFTVAMGKRHSCAFMERKVSVVSRRSPAQTGATIGLRDPIADSALRQLRLPREAGHRSAGSDQG